MQDGQRFRRNRFLAVGGRVGEEVLPRVGVGLGDVRCVGDQIGDGRRDVGVVLVAVGVTGVGRQSLVGVTERGPQAVGELIGVAVGDERVTQCLLLLIGGEREKRRLIGDPVLDRPR